MENIPKVLPINSHTTSETALARKKGWVVSADMGLGHHRAIYPLRSIAEGGLISVGKNDAASPLEKKMWERMLMVYEGFSRARSIPYIGKPIFGIFDAFLRIPSFYPLRDMSNSTFQVNLLNSFVRQGLCGGMLQTIRTKQLPLITSFYAPAIAADMHGFEPIYCIICDADINRVWVAKEPWESRISYFAPCGKAAQRLQAYGVPRERIFLTGFPLPDELLGGTNLEILRADIGQRLHHLDPNKRFWPLHEHEVEHFLGRENCAPLNCRVLTITYAVGGAGAQKEYGEKIAISLKRRLMKGEIRLNLVAGTKEPVYEYFLSVKEKIDPRGSAIQIVYERKMEEYFKRFNDILRETDILWTKPSELSFYTGLGIPLIMTPPLGSQEYFNRKWVQEIQAGMRQENPEYVSHWLFDLLDNGQFAEMAWSGFLKARKQGSYKIIQMLEEGKVSNENSPLSR